MSIKSDIEEIQKINKEIQRLNLEIKKLRKVKAETEQRITTFLKEKDLPGAKLQNTAVILSTHTRHTYKTGKKKEQAIIDTLNRNGVENSKELFELIKEASRKEAYNKDVIQFKKI